MSGCVYHQKGECETKHDSCIKHGHCWNPIECPQFKSCPMHKDGNNMFLAWSAAASIKTKK
jgi:hypothetical protein